MTSDPDLHKRSSDIFLEAIEIEPEHRDEFVRDKCAGDPALYVEVCSLLEHDRGSSSLPPSFAPDPGTLSRLAASDPTPGDRLGPWHLLRLIGSGGMGLVFEAERREPIRQRVAVKLIKAGLDSEEVLSRFHAERQVLALMDHPGMARVFDAGTTPAGRPYFVMEFVDGIPITEYCEASNLSISARIQLLVDVCKAVQHAHVKGVVHRDLKPANILVTEHSGRPAPVIIDFGIAKAIGLNTAGDTPNTRFGVVLGTPEYMSPEQAGLTDVSISALSDIYSLGAVLHELLTGRPPLDLLEAKKKGLEEICRTIREVEPRRPSSLCSVPRKTARGATPVAGNKQLIRLLKSDLDWIVMKALHKDPGARYPSASELAADLTRFVAGDPVLARPPSLKYLAMKMVRKHRGIALTAAALLLAVIAGTAATAWQARIAARERDEARSRLTELQRLSTALVSEFPRLSDIPGGAAAKMNLVRMAATSLDLISKQESSDPEVVRQLASAYASLGQLQGDPYSASLGDSEGAIENLARAVRILDPVVKAHPEDVSLSEQFMSLRFKLGLLLQSRGQCADVLDTLEAAIAMGDGLIRRGQITGTGQRTLADSYNLYAEMSNETGNFEGMQAALGTALEIREDLAGKHPSNDSLTVSIADSYSSLAYIALHGAEAESLARLALEHYEPFYESHPFSRSAVQTLSYAYRDLGTSQRRMKNFTGAIESYEKCRVLRSGLVAADPTDQRAIYLLSEPLRLLAETYLEMGRVDSAGLFVRRASELQEGIRLSQQVPAWIGWELSFTHAVEARILRARGRSEQARDSYRVAILRRGADGASSLPVATLNNWRLQEEVAHFELQAGDTAEAIRRHKLGARLLAHLAGSLEAAPRSGPAAKRDAIAGLIHTAQFLSRLSGERAAADSLESEITRLAAGFLPESPPAGFRAMLDAADPACDDFYAHPYKTELHKVPIWGRNPLPGRPYWAEL